MGTKTTTARAVDHHRPRVLLAEPDVEARDAMRRHLEGQFIVEVAGDGTAALAAIRANAPAIVLAEMRMPGLDGPQLLHQLRSDSQTAHIPVILLSACADVGARWQGLQTEADGYLYQPVSDRELIATVRTHLDLAKRKHEASVEEILQSAKELNDFFDNSSIGFHWVGPDGIILRANRAELEMMGYAENEYVGHHISEFHADEHVINDMLARLSMNQTLRDYEARLRCKNGTIKHVLISSNVYREGNKFIHTRCLTMDVSERRRVSALQAELAAIVESSEDAIISKTLQGIVVSWNAGAERLFGYTAADMIGKPITVLMPADRLGEEEGILNRLARGERIDHVETIRRHKDGQDVHVSLSISPIRDENGQIVGVSKIARNITARKQTEAMLQASEERFRTMALTNARLYRDAQEASRVKDEFLATMSHELRTPLNAVFGWVRMARSGMLDEKGIARALETIERNARAQSQLIDDLLDVSRIVTGKIRLDIRPIDLTGVIQAAVDSIRPTADNKHVRLEVMLDPRAEPLSGDPDRIQQVVWNLLSNAVKYTPKEGRVQVRLERVNSHVEITVSDTGEGISEEFLPYVFDRFRQSDATSTRHHGGLGLGLAIVRHLVELHGGSVHAYSAGVNQGATFTVKTLGLGVTRRPAARRPSPLL